jgi:hypothetical protein
MSEIKVNKISPKQTCTQLTLGDSGDTIIIPAGATITNNGTATGFGRTGTVNWDTTAKTTGFTAVKNLAEAYLKLQIITYIVSPLYTMVALFFQNQ